MKRVLLVLGLLALPLASDAAAETTVQRFAGPTRYDTALDVAYLLHPDGADTAVVAAGTDYPDALAAGVAAAALDAPLVLASADRVPGAELKAMGVREVLLIGGTAALPRSVESEIAAATGATVRRIAGANRFATAKAIADLVTPDAPRTLAVSGMSFETAMVAAAHAARLDSRLLLEPEIDDDAVVVDGVTLHGGPGRLNLALLDRFPPAGDAAIVTTIRSFPDALSAAALAGALDAPVLFTEPSSATQSSVDAYRFFAPDELVVVGGAAAVSEVVLQQLVGYVPLPPVVAPNVDRAIALDVFARINAERSARRVAPLVWDQTLASDATAWAKEMSRTGFRHAWLDRIIGENIHHPTGWCAYGTCVLPTSGLLHRDWMRSADNRDNIVEPGYVIGGVGVYCGPDGTLWAVERFGLGFGTLSAGGSPATPVVHDDIDGIACSG